MTGPAAVVSDPAAATEALCEALQAEIPGFGILYKDESRLHRAIGALVRPLNDRYLQDYTTVLFGKVAFPSRAWRAAVGEAAIYEVLRHEAVHLRDARRFPVLFELSWLLLPLPTVLTLRALWEYRGYAESLRARVDLGLPVDDAWIDWVVARFTGPDYGFMWPFPAMLRRRFRALRAEVTGAAT
ncbi:MAG: hypothetical protein H6747_12255 [Deltaproteobacteria bacterium]|nr:hypothetical protein [Deltaproteobacteria bacterium]